MGFDPMHPASSLRAALMAILAFAASACERGPAEESACGDCNVVLISIDTLRADHLGLYGHSRPTSPTLDRLAESSVVFDRFFNNGGTTLPVHMSMMTSLPPYTHKVIPSHNRRLEDERVTLAERLAEAGWATAAFTDGGWVRRQFGFDQGFQTFDDSGGRLATILPKALDWVEERADQPFFLFVHTYDVHSEWNELPYECPGDGQFTFISPEELTYEPCSDGKCASEKLAWINQRLWSEPDLGARLIRSGIHRQLALLYDGCIRYVDGKVAELIELLRERGLYDRTLLIVTSDHGESFLEHNALLHKSPFEENLRVPLLIKFPDSRYGGRRVGHNGTTIDLAPTVLETLGLPAEPTFRGISLMTTIAEDEPIRDSFSMYQSVRTTRWK
jgi:arylsulfatase A-like enzyme